MSDFLHMGGYAAFVWGSYGAGIAVLLWNLVVPRRAHRDVVRKLRAGGEP